jgi:hypothetical protein
VASGKSTWGGVAVGGQRADGLNTLINNRQDFAFTSDDRYVWAGVPSEEVNKLFYDFTGAEVPAPQNGDKYLVSYIDAGLSPDGKHVAGDFAGEAWTTSSYVIDSATGEKTEIHGQVTIGSDKEVPLSGFLGGSTDVSAGRWKPVFAQR